MAYKILGQSAPSATTNTDLYTVPASTETVCSTLTICNRSGSSATVRVAVRPDGAAISNEHYVLYDMSLAGNNTEAVTIGMTLDATDVVTVYASSADMSFNLFGREIS